jgi:hypothetical protein
MEQLSEDLRQLILDSPLDADQRSIWTKLVLATPNVQGRKPSPQEMEALQELKERKHEFVATLDADQKGFIKKFDKASSASLSGQRAASLSSSSQTSESSDGTQDQSHDEQALQAQQKKQQAKEAARERQAAQEEEKLKKEDLADARAKKDLISNLCKWLKIKLSYEEVDGEAVFEIKLPAWLLKNEVDNIS